MISKNLAQRVATALVLIAVLLLLIFKASSQVFAGALFVFGALAVWELWRLVQPNSKRAAWVMMLVYAGVAVQLWLLQSIAALLVIAVLHAAVTAYVLRIKPKLQHLLTGVYGAVLLACVMVSITVLQSFGAWVLITAFVVVWAADVGGYFFGKGLGGKFITRRLAPQISPKKSWEGAIGGAFLAVLVTVLCVLSSSAQSWMQVWVISGIRVGDYLMDNTALRLLMVHPIVPVTVLVAAYSVTGDLLESMLKRQAGVKDSSQLLPGHGGILDRIDALIPVLPLCAAWAYFVGYRG
jgi:phosphatidate cytidylyltransferase